MVYRGYDSSEPLTPAPSTGYGMVINQCLSHKNHGLNIGYIGPVWSTTIYGSSLWATYIRAAGDACLCVNLILLPSRDFIDV